MTDLEKLKIQMHITNNTNDDLLLLALDDASVRIRSYINKNELNHDCERAKRKLAEYYANVEYGVSASKIGEETQTFSKDDENSILKAISKYRRL